MDQIPERMFPCWVSRVLSIGRTVGYEPALEDMETSITECFMNLLQLGTVLSLQNPVRNLKIVILQLSQQYLDDYTLEIIFPFVVDDLIGLE